MGCDLHYHIEVRHRKSHEKGGRYSWDHADLSTECTDRSYAVFGALAGVRSDEVKPIDEPRGLPSDVTEETREGYETKGGGCHSASWCDAHELRKACKRVKGRFGWMPVNLLAAAAYMEAYEQQGYETRFVFYFDS